jgi:hypothetical protein
MERKSYIKEKEKNPEKQEGNKREMILKELPSVTLYQGRGKGRILHRAQLGTWKYCQVHNKEIKAKEDNKYGNETGVRSLQV